MFLLAKNVFVEYSDDLVIKDNVANGVILEPHHHIFHSRLSVSKDVVTPTSLIIEEGVMLGSRAIIFPSCNYKGLNAKVGAKPLLQDFK